MNPDTLKDPKERKRTNSERKKVADDTEENVKPT